MKLFISHAHHDREAAANLVQLLKLRKFDAWTAAEQLETGMDWKAGVAQAISESDAFVFLVGLHSEEDRGQQIEWQTALESDWDHEPARPMVPILLGEVRVPAFLTDRVVLHTGQAQEFPVDQIVHLLLHSEETRVPINYDLARQEQTRRLNTLKEFALSLKAASPRLESRSSSH